MKRILLVGYFISQTLYGIGQILPNTSQNFQFSPLYNPAFTGIEGYKDLKLSYRYQWTGLGSDAPKFINVAYNFRLKEPLDLTLNAIRTSMAKAQNNEIPKIKKVIHGLGANVFSEKEKAITRVGGGVNYSFHYPLTKKIRLAVGLNAAVYNIKINRDELYFGKDDAGNPINPNDDPVYRELMAGSSYANLNMKAGFLLYASKFYFGFSYLPIVNKAIIDVSTGADDIQTTIGKAQYYRGVIQAGYAFPVNATMDIKPSILALWGMDNKFVIDYNVKVYVQEKIWFGLTYRDVKSIAGIVGFNLNERLGASYSYEISGSKLQTFSDGSHDLVLSVRLNNFKRQRQQTW
jgi:type IX secretion system PorP/SprF family membrane protein